MITLRASEVLLNSIKMRREVLAEPHAVEREISMPASADSPAFIAVIPAKMEVSILTEDCGNLTSDARCAIYDAPHRPQACPELIPGSEACMRIRNQAGIIDP